MMYKISYSHDNIKLTVTVHTHNAVYISIPILIVNNTMIQHRFQTHPNLIQALVMMIQIIQSKKSEEDHPHLNHPSLSKLVHWVKFTEILMLTGHVHHLLHQVQCLHHPKLIHPLPMMQIYQTKTLRRDHAPLLL